MYPHRDYYRSVPTMRSLPIAIKSSSEYNWTSVTVSSQASSMTTTTTTPTLAALGSDELLPPSPLPSLPKNMSDAVMNNPYQQFPSPTRRYKSDIIKEHLRNNLRCTRICTIIFHLSNLAHFLVVPYLYVFHPIHLTELMCAYCLAILNDIIYFVYVCLRFRTNGRVLQWLYHCTLIMPFWQLYAEIVKRHPHRRWMVRDIDMGFLLTRCWPCPLRMALTVHPFTDIVKYGEYGLTKHFLKFISFTYLLLHAMTVIMGLVAYVIADVPQKPLSTVNDLYNNTNMTPLHSPRTLDLDLETLPNFFSTLTLASLLMTAHGLNVPLRHLANLFVIFESLLSIIFAIYCKSYFFLLFDVRNKRLIKLQHFTKTLIRHVKHTGNKALLRRLMHNHFNVEGYKRAVALNECNAMLEQVNWSLVQEVLFDINLPALKVGLIFGLKHENADCYVRHLSSKMRRETYNTKETIWRERDAIEKMVVIVEGVVEVLAQDQETSMLHLGVGTCFGQAGLLLQLHAKATVRCVTYVRTIALDKKDFMLSTLSAFPEIYQVIYRTFMNHLNESKKRKRTMMMRPPQYDVTVSERANSQVYVVMPVNINHTTPTIPSSVNFCKNTMIGRVDEDMLLNALWNYMMVLISIVVAIFYPYYATFHRTFPPHFRWIVAAPMDVLIVIDLVLTMITFEKHPIDTSKKRILRSLRSHMCVKLTDWSFYLDFFAAIYFEHFTFILNETSMDPEQINFLFYLLKLNRILKIYKLFHLVWALRFFNDFYKRLFLHTLSISLLIYYGAIALYLMACFQATCRPESWFRRLQVEEYYTQTWEPRTADKFLSAIYASLDSIHRLETHRMVGVLEEAVSLTLTFFGWVMVALCFSDLDNLHYLQLKPRVYYRRDVADISTLAQHCHFPVALRRRLIAYYRMQYSHDPYYFHHYTLNQHGNNYMTKGLCADMLFAQRMATLMLVPVFHMLGKKFTEFITLKTKVYLLPARDIITYTGNMNKEMLVVKSGHCVCKTKDSYYKRIGPMDKDNRNAHFGMASLFFNLPEVYTVKTLTPCELISIDGAALQEALLQHGPANDILRRTFGRAASTTDLASMQMEMSQPNYTTAHAEDESSHAGMLDRFVGFIKQNSFVNVLSYCAKRKEDYGHHYVNEEISIMMYFMLPFTVIPWGNFFDIWVVIRMAVSYLYGITCPLMFLYEERNAGTLFALNVLSDTVLYVDMIILAYLCYTRNGILIVHPLKTLRHYGSHGLVIDSLLNMPYEWFYRVKNEDYRMFCFLRCIKMVQTYKFFVILAKLKSFDKRYIDIFSEIIKCVMWTILIVHGIACLQLAGSCDPVGLQQLRCRAQSWLARSDYGNLIDPKSGLVNVTDAYSVATYWTTTIFFGLSFNDIITQGGANLKIVILLILLGIFMRGYYLKSLVSYWLARVEEHNHTRTTLFCRQLNHLTDFLRREHVDHQLRRKMRRNGLYYWQRTYGINSTALLSRLHTTLLQDSLSFLYEDTLSQVRLFQNIDRSFLRIIALIARPMYFLPDQVIINVEDVCDQFYIIHDGTVHVQLARSSYQVNLRKGSLLGYYCKETTPVMSIIAKTVNHVDVLCIKSIDYFNILKNYTVFEEQLKNVLSEYKDFMPNRAMEDNMVNVLISRKTSSWVIVRNMQVMLVSTRFYKMLDIIVAFFAFINCMLVAFTLIAMNPLVLLFNVCIDAIFLCASAVRFFQPYYDDRGVLITNQRMIRAKLRRDHTWLTVVICANIILMLAYVVYYVKLTTVYGHAYQTFAFMRLAALYRCEYLKRRSFRHLDDNIFLEQLFHFLMCIILVLHWLACGWCMINNIADDGMTTVDMKLIEICKEYCESLLLVVNLFTSTATRHRQFPYHHQRVCIIVTLIVVRVFASYLISRFTICLWIHLKPVVQFNYRLRQLCHYLSTIKIAPFQIRALSEHLLNLERDECGQNFPVVLSDLPTPLVEELKVALYQVLLEKCYIFHGTQPNFQRNVAIQLQRAVYYRNEVIVHHGEINSCMYFIHAGNVEIVTINENHTETQHDVLQAGEMFGLAQGLFKHRAPHQFTFKALTKVTIMRLQLKQWEHLLRHFPKSKEIIYDKIRNVQMA